MKLEQTSLSTITALWRNIEPNIQQSTCLEEASQTLAGTLYTEFEESVVLARVFLTLPFSGLPPANKEFVQKLVESAGVSGLKGTTPVLSLLGTRGEKADWNDRCNSRGHLGIPLISSAFVDAIPMISRLLKELGVPLAWVDSHDSEIIRLAVGRSAALFFVENAADATDTQGRKIIAAQDFVSTHLVKSVFGAGRAYCDSQILVMIVFCRDFVSRATAQRFLTLTESFESKSAARFGTNKVFATM